MENNQFYTQPQRPKKKRSARRACAAVLLVVLCFGAGIGGSYLGIQIWGKQNTSSTSLGITSNVAYTETSELSEMIETIKPTVVEITTELVSTESIFMQQYISSGAGSGVILTEDGYIATNYHVIEDATKITVRTKSGEEYEATLVGADEETDLALLKIEAQGLTPAVIGDSDALSEGDVAIVIGNPLGSLGGTVTRGIISALNREIEVEGQMMTLLQTDAAVNPGNSGGGLFNAAGQLVGIVNAKSEGVDVEGLGFAIPINEAMKVLNDLKENGYVTGRVYLGISMVDIETQQQALMYRVNGTGLYVAQVVEGSAADKAGLQVGDRIVSINGVEVQTSTELKEQLETCAVGDTILLQVDRDGKTMAITATLQERTE